MLLDTFDTIDDKWDFFHTEVLDIFFITSYPRWSKYPTPWFTDKIQLFIKSKNKAKHQADRSGDPSDKHYFQQLKNELKASIRQVRVDYLKELMQQSWSCY